MVVAQNDTKRHVMLTCVRNPCGGQVMRDPLEPAEFVCLLCSHRFVLVGGFLLDLRRPPTHEEAEAARSGRGQPTVRR